MSPRTRTVLMTVYAIEADQCDVTRFDEVPGTRFVNGRIAVKAHGEGHHHEFVVTGGRRWWPGDTFVVEVEEEATA